MEYIFIFIAFWLYGNICGVAMFKEMNPGKDFEAIIKANDKLHTNFIKMLTVMATIMTIGTYFMRS